jgi:hypothetical protein
LGEVTTLPAEAAGLQPPEALAAKHDLSKFRCKEYPELADWLQQRGPKNEGLGSRTYVLPIGSRVVGYYSLAAGSVMYADVNAKTRRNMPEPIPVMVIGRLAVDDEFSGRGLGYGGGLLKDALLRCLSVSRLAGVRAAVVHAKDEKAAGFYRHYKFVQSPTNPLTLFLPIETIIRALASPVVTI